MKVLIIGCGKFGVRLAEYLTRKNHEIVVVDNDPETFHALGAEFTGRTICGVGYDKAVLEQAGVAAIAVHGRTREQMYAPPVNVDIIRQVKEAVSIPVIGNGDIFTPKDAADMYEQTGCDLVMVGRGALASA